MFCTLPASWVTRGKNAPQCRALGNFKSRYQSVHHIGVWPTYIWMRICIWTCLRVKPCCLGAQCKQCKQCKSSPMLVFFLSWLNYIWKKKYVHLETDNEVRQAKDGGHTFAKTSDLKTNLAFSQHSAVLWCELRLKSWKQTCVWRQWHVSGLLHWIWFLMIFVLLLPIIAVSHSGMPPPVPAQEPSESQSLQRVEIVRGWGWQQSKRQWRVAWEQTNLVSLCSRGSWMCKAGHWLNVYAYCNCKKCKFGFAVVHCCATLNYQRESNTFRTTGVIQRIPKRNLTRWELHSVLCPTGSKTLEQFEAWIACGLKTSKGTLRWDILRHD